MLSFMNDELKIEIFEDQLMVDMPFSFSDGDLVSLIVFPVGQGYKVTDGGDTALKLDLLGVDMTRGAVADTWDTLTAGLAQKNFSPEGDEIAVVVGPTEVPRGLLEVALNCIRAEQAKIKAVPPRSAPFSEQVNSRIHTFIEAGHQNAIWEKNKAIRLSSGRQRQITGVFKKNEDDRMPLLVQAVGGRNQQERNDPADRAFTIFSNVDRAREDKLVVAIGDRSSWDKGMIRELSDVAQTVFFNDQTELERVLNWHLNREMMV
jgi:hypothetical protein